MVPLNKLSTNRACLVVVEFRHDPTHIDHTLTLDARQSIESGFVMMRRPCRVQIESFVFVECSNESKRAVAWSNLDVTDRDANWEDLQSTKYATGV